MKLHEFQEQLKNRPAPTFRYHIYGGIARFNLDDWGALYPKKDLANDLEEALARGLDCYGYNSYNEHVLLGTKANKQAPWRVKVGRSYKYCKKSTEAVEEL